MVTPARVVASLSNSAWQDFVLAHFSGDVNITRSAKISLKGTVWSPQILLFILKSRLVIIHQIRVGMKEAKLVSRDIEGKLAEAPTKIKP